MSKITDKKFEELNELLDKREISCEELMNESLDRINNYDDKIESFINTYHRKDLIKQARESDKRRKEGKKLSPIDGFPIAVKDNMHSMGIKTTCGSRILQNYDPPFDATAIANLKAKGGIVTGKTNLDEFAMGSTSETSAYKLTKNPWDSHKVPGGSSGGSAAAVCAGMSPLALGSDTGGSIRQPASFCGIVGIKPTYGLVSRYGLVAYASSLDQIGTLSRDVYGAASLLNVIAGYDKKDSTSLEAKIDDYTKNLGKDIKGLKIAVFPELHTEGIAPEVKALFDKSLELFKAHGAIVEEISFPVMQYLIPAYYFIATAEASSNLSRYDGVKYGYRSPQQANFEEMLFNTRSVGLGKEVKKRILLGNFVLSSGYYDEYYRKAQKVRALIMQELKKVFETYDIIATPTTPDIAMDLGEGMNDPLKMYLADITTAIANLAGIPALSVPCGIAKHMPIGLQLIGKPLSENLLLQTAYTYEKAVNLDLRPNLDQLKTPTAASSQITAEEEESVMSAVYSKEKIKEISDSYDKRKKFDYTRVYCQDLEQYVGKKQVVSGWIHKINSLGGIEFYTLRDRTGMTQLVIEGSNIDIQKLTCETVITVEGLITKEDRSPYNNIEVKVEKLEILGSAKSDIPINVNGSYDNITLPTILDYRPVSIRNPKVLSVFKIQSELVGLFSSFLRAHNFTEIKSPKIISSGTEGGTNIFELKYFDGSAFLAQSPQFYKQIMVGSGFERVFEVGPVFRAEKHDTIRHLNEYTSMDFEMGFIKDEQDIIDMQEKLIIHMFGEVKEKYPEILNDFDVDFQLPANIPRLHFLEALEIADRYGVKNMDGDISPEGERVICDYVEKEYKSSFVYIVGYPVKKRPMYTMPDERLPGYTRSFDLLFKGLEITTGGQRIHKYQMLWNSIKAHGSNPNDFKDYLLTFKYGMPPHGGLGMGLERITMKLLDLKNVREATLFPRDRSRISP